MKLIVRKATPSDPYSLAACCPHCGKEAVLDDLGIGDIEIDSTHLVGQRSCPNPDCRGHLFIVSDGNRIISTYPPIRIDFNKEDIPGNILETFEEAISCHAISCFVASALMIRRTLEILCADRQAKGGNLKERIKDLGAKIIIPKELLEAMDELRLLGNDAAHIEAQTFSKISTEEVEIAIEFTKEILKAVYQYSGLLGRLRSLKQTKEQP